MITVEQSLIDAECFSRQPGSLAALGLNAEARMGIHEALSEVIIEAERR